MGAEAARLDVGCLLGSTDTPSLSLRMGARKGAEREHRASEKRPPRPYSPHKDPSPSAPSVLAHQPCPEKKRIATLHSLTLDTPSAPMQCQTQGPITNTAELGTQAPKATCAG